MKKGSQTIKIIIMILCLFLVTGCWDSKDIEKKEILTTLIIDKKNDKYYYYMEGTNISGETAQKDGNSNNQELNFSISKGNTFAEARDDFNRKSVKEIYLGAGRILIFTDRMSKNGIEEYVNRLRGQIDYRKSISIATTDAEPEDIIKIKPENATSVGFAIESNFDNLIQNGTSFPVNIGDILQIMAVKKVGFLLPNINIKEKKTILTGYSVFKNEKKIGEIPANNRMGVVFLLNNKSEFYYNIYQSNKKYLVKVILTNKDIKPVYTNNQLAFNVNMKFNMIINLIDKMDPISQEDYTSIGKKVEELTKEKIKQAIDTSQNKYECDYLNFYKYFRIYYLKEFEKADWSELYSKAKINIITHVNIVESNIPLK